jgi:hypothetical protein
MVPQFPIRMMRIQVLAMAAGCLIASACAAAPLQVALVENVSGNSAGVELMDYLETGRTIRLGPRDTIVISYLSSCMRETITGGTVTVGMEESEVQSGKVARNKVQCDAGKMLVPAEGTSQFGGRIFRGASGGEPPILYGRSPILEVKAPGKLVIQRIDQSNERYELDLSKQQLVRGAFYDFTRSGRTLVPGGTYRASMTYKAGSKPEEVEFKIDPAALPGHTPLSGRLLRFIPSS